MKIALYGKVFSPDFNESINNLMRQLRVMNTKIIIHSRFARYLSSIPGLDLNGYQIFDDKTGLPEDTDFLFSLGGDGTFLETLHFVRTVQVPVLGINTGRLGFLANISREEIPHALDMLQAGKYSLESRSLIQLGTSSGLFNSFNVALNEITIHKQNASMITIDTELDGEYLNSYWADGLIISTPTGSTAYSMSVGGPIVLPESRNFIISPIAPHNLSVRPIVVPDHKKIKLRVRSRSDKFLVALDSHSYIVEKEVELYIEKAPFSINLLKFPTDNFYNTLRNKLMWGVDKRN